MRYTNYCYDLVIDKYFAQARFYDSGQGRMLDMDPVRAGLIPGTGKALSLAADFAAGTVGSALEQMINGENVDWKESLASGLTNAIGGKIYGNTPLKSGRSSFGRGAAAGGTTAGIQNLLGVWNSRDTGYGSLHGGNPGAGGYGAIAGLIGASPHMRMRDPKAACGIPSPRSNRIGYGSVYGYQYGERPRVSGTTGMNRGKKGGFDLLDFAKDVGIGMVTVGLGSAGFYGMGKVVSSLANGIRGTFGSKGGSQSIGRPTQGQGFSERGYNPKPGERTFNGYVNKNVPRDVETKLYTSSNNFNTNPRNDGHFKRFGTEPNQHGIVGPHVHQPTRNINPNNGIITGKPGSKTKNGGVTVPGEKDIKQLYEYLINGKYRKG